MKRETVDPTLQKIPGLTLSQASLLEASGVRSAVDLARNQPEKLHRWMVEVNQEQRIVRRMPTLESVSQWIFNAKTFQPI